MPSLITETTIDQPKILLISDGHALQHELVLFLEKKHIQVKIVSASFFTKNTRQEFIDQAFYKIIWVVEYRTDDPVDLEEVFRFLTPRQEPLSVVCDFVTPIRSSQPQVKDWVGQSFWQQQFLDYVLQNFPRASICIAQDLVGVRRSCEAPFSYLLNQDPNSFLDPGVSLTPHNIVAFMERMQEFFFHPPGIKRWVVSGPPVISAQILEIAQQVSVQQGRGELNIAQISAESLGWEKSFHVSQTHEVDVHKLV